jgi:hypothetical protein
MTCRRERERDGEEQSSEQSAPFKNFAHDYDSFLKGVVKGALGSMLNSYPSQEV